MDNLLSTCDSKTARAKWTGTLVQMLDSIQATLMRLGMKEEQAAQTALAIVYDHATNFGGIQYYLPKGDELKRALRDREIYRLAGKTDVAVLAQRYNLSTKQIWEIQRTQHALHIKKIQPALL